MNTFEITIQRAQNESWPVVVRHQPGPAALTMWASGTFDLDLKQLDILLPSDRQYGLLLGQNLFRNEVRDAFARALSGAKAASQPLRVWLIVEAKALRSLHWEQLCAPFEGERWEYLSLNQQTPFSLYLPSQIEPRFPPIGRRDLRALLLVAGPEDLGVDYQLAPFGVLATVDALTASLREIPKDVRHRTPCPRQGVRFFQLGWIWKPGRIKVWIAALPWTTLMMIVDWGIVGVALMWES